MPRSLTRPDRHVPGFTDLPSAQIRAKNLVGGARIVAVMSEDFTRQLAYVVVPITQGCPCCMKLEAPRAPT